LLNVLDAVAKARAGFRSLKDTWADTTTPHGRLMLTVLGGLAEFERAKRPVACCGTPRRFAAVQRFGRDRSEADMRRTLRACRSDAFDPTRTSLRELLPRARLG